ncbi:hypothetical protein ABZ490_40900 [Streptomyces sp. NPDC005811]|uniref:hypothetical protein n=1 Tax=Streptomyces sp. NPDC005811 TaxID=3154565 RepID=UPI0033DC7A7E
MARVPSAEVVELALSRGFGSHLQSGCLYAMEDGPMLGLALAATACGLGATVMAALLMPPLIPAAALLAVAPEPVRRWRLRQPRPCLHCFEGGLVFVKDQRDHEVEVYVWSELRLEVVRTPYDSDYAPGVSSERISVIIRTRADNATVCSVLDSDLCYTLRTLPGHGR